MSLPGQATAEGTKAYAERMTNPAPGHFRSATGLHLSSIGIGTYLGDHDESTDGLYAEAVRRAVELGCNVIDSAINYRFQRSERCIAKALQTLCGNGFERNQIVIATKGGFIPFDGAPPSDAAQWFNDTFIKPGIAQPEDIIAGCHCMTPSYLQHQLDTSLRNLDVECIDIYYVHNPETQLQEVSKEEFLERLKLAFERLEENVAAGKIAMYGAATWNAFRMQTSAVDYLALEEVVEAARQVAGDGHHFKVVQLPLNLGMLEALGARNQPLQGETTSALEAARALDLIVMASASIYQGQVAAGLPPIVQDTFPGLATDAQRALQFTRSTPGLTVALVGMKQTAHVEENLALAAHEPAPLEQYLKLFGEPE